MKSNSKSRKKPLSKSSYSMSLPRDYPWKVLGWLTEDLGQFLKVEDRELLANIVRNRDLDSLLSLPEVWGLQCIPSMDGDLLEKAARYQLAALLKKFRFRTERDARLSKAKEKFLAGEEKCSAFNREGFMLLAAGKEPWNVNVFTYARSFLQKLLGFEPLDPGVMTERSRHGPGATLDTKPGFVSAYFKFEAWPYQCTSAAIGAARSAIEADERWLGALEDDYRERFGIPKHAILNRQTFWANVFEVVDGNRISFVPKDARTERSIAIEPTMNLYLQLGVDGFIRRRLKRWGVDLDHQEKNQVLARQGSLDGVDPFVTIDLANASNTISLKLCELLLPPDWFNYLRRLRSPKGILDEQVIDYQMISSMGNGYTFALESAIFTAIIYGVMMETLGSFDRESFAVFGDDLIVRSSLSSRLIESLTNCGFEINMGKSCFSGIVTESCGTDWFQGHPIRPVFLDDVPSFVDELFTDINRLKRILELRWCVEESKTVGCMLRWVPEEFRKFVGPYSDESFDSYLHQARSAVPYRRCVYKYRVVRRMPLEVKAEKLHFRKLMHDLHPVPRVLNPWDRLDGCGGRFSVYRRNAFTLSQSCSVVSNWRSEYAECGPA